MDPHGPSWCFSFTLSNGRVYGRDAGFSAAGSTPSPGKPDQPPRFTPNGSITRPFLQLGEFWKADWALRFPKSCTARYGLTKRSNQNRDTSRLEPHLGLATEPLQVVSAYLSHEKICHLFTAARTARWDDIFVTFATDLNRKS